VGHTRRVLRPASRAERRAGPRDAAGDHDTSAISDGLWRELAAAFSVEQIFELIALVGFYHTVSFFANGLKLAPEPFAAPPPSA
jgi:hypothetical protein